MLSGWVQALSHIFPLTWEFHLVRDIITRGAGLADISKEFGGFLLYIGIVAVLFCLVFYKARAHQLAAKPEAATVEG